MFPQITFDREAYHKVEPYVYMLTASLQITIGFYFGINWLFGAIWTVLAFNSVTTRFIMKPIDVIRVVKTNFDDSVERLGDIFEQKVVGVVDSVRDNLLGIEEEDLSFKSISQGFNKHKAGIGLCVKSISSSTDATTIIGELLKMGSMIGLERNLTTTILSRLTRFATRRVAGERIVQNSLTDALPAVATILSACDFELTDVNFDKFITKQGNNLRNLKTINENIRILTDTFGLTNPEGFSELKALSESTITLRTEFEEFALKVQTEPFHFFRNAYYERVTKFKAGIQELNTKLMRITNPKTKNTSLFSTTKTIVDKGLDLIIEIEKIRNSNSIRVEPVGVNIIGPSQIGKSTLVTKILSLVKRKLAQEHQILFPSANEYQVWHRNASDEFHTGYFQQQIVVADDAWCRKDNKDHPDVLNWISPIPIGTVGASLEAKGLPFTSVLYIATTNQLPRTSITIDNINALHNRFNINISCKSLRKPTVYDPDFRHLDLRISTMTEAVDGTAWDEMTPITVDQIVQRIVSDMIIKSEFYTASMQTLNTIHQLMDPSVARQFGVNLEEDTYDSLSDMSVIDEEEEEQPPGSSGIQHFSSDESESENEDEQGAIGGASRVSSPDGSVVEYTDLRFRPPAEPCRICRTMHVRNCKNEVRHASGQNIGIIGDFRTYGSHCRVCHVQQRETDCRDEYIHACITQLRCQFCNYFHYEIECGEGAEARALRCRQLRIPDLGPPFWDQVRNLRPEGRDAFEYTRVTANRTEVQQEMEKLTQYQVYQAHRIAESLFDNGERPNMLRETRQLGDWIYCLQMRTTRETYEELAAAGRITNDIYEFISALGVWDLIPGSDDRFTRSWNQQKIIKIEDQNMGTDYYWGPMLANGTELVVHSDELLSWAMEVRSYIPPVWINQNRVLTNEDIDMVARSLRHRNIIRGGLSIVGVTLGIQQASLGLFYAGMAIMPIPVARRIRQARFLVRTALFINPLPELFNLLERKVATAKHTVYGALIDVLEFIGVDVTPLIEEITLGVSSVVVDACIAGFIAVICYSLYRIMNYALKPSSIDHCNESNDPRDRSGPEHQRGKFKNSRRANDKAREVQRVLQRSACGHIVAFCRCDVCARTEKGKESNMVIKVDKIMFSRTALKGAFTAVSNSIADSVDDYYFIVTEEGILRSKDECNQFRVDKPLIKIDAFPWQTRWDGKEDEEKPINVIQFTTKFTCNLEDLTETAVSELLKVKELNPRDFQVNIALSLVNTVAHVSIQLLCLNSLMEGRVAPYTRVQVARARKMEEIIKGYKPVDLPEVSSVMLKSDADFITSLRENNQVYIEKIVDNLSDIGVGSKQYAIGSGDKLYTNAHTAKIGDLFRVWRKFGHHKSFHVAECIVSDTNRDLAICKLVAFKDLPSVISKKGLRSEFSCVSPQAEQFRDISKHLLNFEAWKKTVGKGKGYVVLPRNNVVVPCHLKYDGERTWNVKDPVTGRDSTQSIAYLTIDHIQMSPVVPMDGDCGGLVVAQPVNGTPSIVGIFSGTATHTWIGSCIWLDEVKNLGFNDTWSQLIVKGRPRDLPEGPEVKHIGTYIGDNRPISKTSLTHWKKSPFANEFEEQLAPTPMSVNDKRITKVLKENQDGQASLIMEISSIIAQPIPAINEEIIDEIVDMLVGHYDGVLEIEQTPNDLDELCQHGINGGLESVFDKGLKITSSPGLPWTNFSISQKSELIECDDKGNRTYNSDPKKGQLLRTRVRNKLKQANQGERIISLVATKWKDSLIKLPYVEQGRGRIFQCAPVEKVIADKALFGNVKDAFTRAGLKAHHALSINPHSLEWHMLAITLRKHPNYLDLDFKNYDRMLHGPLIRAAYNILSQVIQRQVPDKWDKARKVLTEEAINTYMVDFNTVYTTNRGNKSGEFLTTIINCICNLILSIYCWIELTGKVDIVEFFDNVETFSFGDDVIESVSDKYSDRYNYLTRKKVLENIGHTITPGNKDGIESAFTEFENLQFLKRKFVINQGKYTGPLLLRSLESPFVWTKLKVFEYNIWKELVKDKMFEAALHGEEYYNNFIIKLSKCSVNCLKIQIADLLTIKYKQIMRDYFAFYYGRS